jgi:uncharacterized protein YndB with AHSA1/START domain
LVEAKWSETAHDSAPSHDGGSMWICLLVNEKSLELRPGGETRGKWRIPDEKVGERYVVMFRALKVVAPACVN